MSSPFSTSDQPARCNAFNSTGEPLTPGINAFGVLPLDILEWYPAYQSCQRYFLNHAQHDYAVQAVTALINIRLPFQWVAMPVTPSAGAMAYNLPLQRQSSITNFRSQSAPAWVSLVPYIQRLVVTGMDKEGIMHGFFGEDWKKGIGHIHEHERRNYMFAAKSVGWAHVRYMYDISSYESVPFMTPLQDIHFDLEAPKRSGAGGGPWRIG
ncbi:hypothetical protein DPSP01_014096 [Paraphaeosphaeria sporulosa]